MRAEKMNFREVPEHPAINYRSAMIARAENGGPSTIDEKTRSVDIVLATEEPALVYDYDRGRIREVLLMSGAQIPASGQLVLLNAHSRYDLSDIIGSARNVRTAGREMVGRAFYSEAPEAESPWLKTKEGHLTDYSVGYTIQDAVWIPEGQTATIEGRTFEGPLQVATKWTPKEISAVPIGADQNAKARAEVNNNNKHNKEEGKMDPKIRKMLESKGLPADANDEQAIAFLEKLGVKESDPPKVKETDDEAKAKEEKIRAEATGKERDRIREIDALCGQFDCADMSRALIVDGKTLEEAQRAVMSKLHEKSKNPGTSGVVIVAEARDKFRAAAQDGIMLRAGMKIEKPVVGADELRGYTLAEMARECLRVAGLNHHGTLKEMVGRALTTSDFPYILANLATNSLQQAWETAPSTWRIWAGIGSVSDFKTYYDNAVSEHDDLDEIPDSGEMKMGGFSEKAPETYKIASYGKKFKVTRVMIINDDLGALRELPAKRAEAAARKIDDIVYAVLTANGNMADGNAIFDSATHANDCVSGYLSAPSTANIGKMIEYMKKQKDISGKRRLNIQPQFFLAPVALEGASEVFFKSEKFDGTSAAATRTNIYAGNYFTRVYEPRLDDDSTTAYYILGPKGKTVKVVFLNGQEGPILEMTQPGFTVEGFEYAVVQDVGAYAVDYRGMVRNEGA